MIVVNGESNSELIIVNDMIDDDYVEVVLIDCCLFDIGYFVGVDCFWVGWGGGC